MHTTHNTLHAAVGISNTPVKVLFIFFISFTGCLATCPVDEKFPQHIFDKRMLLTYSLKYIQLKVGQQKKHFKNQMRAIQAENGLEHLWRK